MSNGVKISGCGLGNNRYTDEDGGVHSVARLVALAADLEPFDVPLRHLCISPAVFRPITTARDLADHVKRVQDTSLDYPIIMDRDGFIMDGWHRVVKALVEGRETIKAVRFDETPSPEFYEDRP